MREQGNNETTTAMWQSWCRLCANHDNLNFDIFKEPYLSILNIPFIINKFFHVHIKQDGDLPLSLCAECCSTLGALQKYAQHISKVQEMYQDLRTSKETAGMDIRDIFEKYEIIEWKPFIHHLSLEEVAKVNPASVIEEIIVEGNVKNLLVKDNLMGKCQVTDYEDKAQIEISDPLTNEYNMEENSLMSDDNDGSSSKSVSLGTDDVEEKAELSNQNEQNLSITKPSNKRSNGEVVYTCNSCQKNFETSRIYAVHMKIKHGVNITPWNCQQCGTSFRIKKELKRHERKVHDPSVYPCPHCNRIFKLRKFAQNHIKKEHEGEGSLICEECGESVRSNDALLEHMAIHTGRGAFECNECGKHFAKKCNLRMHLQTHGDKHVCGECGAELTTSKALAFHMKVHSDEMPYKCDYCGRRFKRTKNLKGHLITHTGLQPYSCDFCDKTFSTATSCRYHKKHLHPKELAAMEAAGMRTYTKNIPQISVLRAITQAATEVKNMGACLSNKRMKLPKLDAELCSSTND